MSKKTLNERYLFLAIGLILGIIIGLVAVRFPSLISTNISGPFRDPRWPIGHDTDISSVWHHGSAFSRAWPPSHAPFISSFWPRNHPVAVSHSWPPVHDAVVTASWPTPGQPGWHFRPPSSHWPPGHDRDVSLNYPPRHSAQVSNEWPVGGHTFRISNTYPRNHTWRTGSLAWPPNHNALQSANDDFPEETPELEP